jgi:hypothetical protein
MGDMDGVFHAKGGAERLSIGGLSIAGVFGVGDCGSGD